MDQAQKIVTSCFYQLDSREAPANCNVHGIYWEANGILMLDAVSFNGQFIDLRSLSQNDRAKFMYELAMYVADVLF